MDTDPAIVLVSEHHADVLLDEFGRYARDYDLPRRPRRPREAARRPRGPATPAGQVAMFVTESMLPDADVLAAFHKLRELVPDRAPRGRRALGPLPRPTAGACGPAWPRASTTPTC